MPSDITEYATRSAGSLDPSIRRRGGHTYGQLRAARDRGELKHFWRGMDVVASLTTDELTRARAAQRAVRAGILSGPTAARVHGLSIDRRLDDEITVPPPASPPRTRNGLRIVARNLPPGQVVSRGDLQLTDLPLTTADLLRLQKPAEALWILDQAYARGLTDIDIAPFLLRGARGVVQARRLLPLGDQRSESALETALRLLWLGAGLPKPVLQWIVLGHSGTFVARTDFGWPDSGVIAEADGRAVHEAPAALLADRIRQNALAELGLTVLRFTWQDVWLTPGRTIDTVRAALLQR